MLAEILVKQGLEMSDEGIAEIPVLIGPIIDEAIDRILNTSKCKYLSELIDGIVRAVWGCRTYGRITDCQAEITGTVVSLMEEIREIFEVSNLNPAQQFALDYLIRGFIMSRVIRMADVYRIDIGEKIWRQQCFSASLCLN